MIYILILINFLDIVKFELNWKIIFFLFGLLLEELYCCYLEENIEVVFNDFEMSCIFEIFFWGEKW